MEDKLLFNVEENLLLKAKAFMYSAHAGQTYGEGKPFVIHPIETYRIIELIYPADLELQCAALLHDTIEDGGVTYEELRREFGAEIANLVDEVTKSEYNTFPNLETQRGVVLKFADRLANLSHMDGWDDEKKQKYITKSQFWKK